MTEERPEKNQKQTILVTGAHRTGTSWVGKMLAASREVAYVSEPLNRWHRPGVMLAPVHHWYTYICEENEKEFLPALQETRRFRYHTIAELRSVASLKDLLRMGRDWSIFFKGRLYDQTLLLKDPFAVFSAAWFADRLDSRVVFTVRHPAGFVSSLKKLGWEFDFSDLLGQPLLMRDWLEPYRAEMEVALKSPQDIISGGSLLWRMVYSVVGQLCERNPRFLVMRHEDVSLDPAGCFKKLYFDLGLRFTPEVLRAIRGSSAESNPRELTSRKVHSVSLDSRANLENWKHRLNDREITRIRQLTASVSDRFYQGTNWD